METAEEAGQEVFTTGEEERIPDAAACSREEGKEEEEVEVSFDELGLDEQLKRALRKKGIAKATPIQREAIPLILEGKDVVAKAKTGSGKTFAYLLPLLHELLKLSTEGRIRKPAPNAFILVPTRELCQQDKTVTTHHAVASELTCQVIDQPKVVIDGNLITGKGLGTVVDYALAIIRKFFGHGRAKAVANGIVFEYPKS